MKNTPTHAHTHRGDGDEDGDEGAGEVKKREKLHKSCRRDMGNGRDLVGGKRKNVDEKGLVQ